jgi:hypothetical protein
VVLIRKGLSRFTWLVKTPSEEGRGERDKHEKEDLTLEIILVSLYSSRHGKSLLLG